MTVLSSTFAFFVSIVSVIYLALKFKYFRDNKDNIRKKRLKNVIDLTFSVSILIFSVLHVNSFINSLQNEMEPESYIRYIVILIMAYFVWAYLNVRQFRKERENVGNTRKKRK